LSQFNDLPLTEHPVDVQQELDPFAHLGHAQNLVGVELGPESLKKFDIFGF